MKRKSRPLITGGLLGLAGLGLLPRGAEAAPEGTAITPDPSLGAALAADPHPVVVPEPTAQIVEPQVADVGAPQPVWTPEAAGAVVAAAAPAPATTAPAAPTPAVLSPSAPPAPDLAAAESSGADSLAPEPSAPAAAPDSATPAAAKNVVAEPPLTPAPAIAQPEPVEAVAPDESVRAESVRNDSAETLADASVKPAAPASQRPAPVAEGSVPVAVGAIASAPRQAVTDVATLRSRATTVQALLRDLRTAYGLEPAVSRPVSQPETLGRGPQLPPLPGRSALSRSAADRSRQKLAGAGQIPVAVLPTAPANPRQSGGREPQLPSFGPASNVALALPAPQLTLSSGRVVQPAPPADLAAVPPAEAVPPALAQTTPATPEATQLRDQLRVAPLTAVAATRSFPPSPNAGIPSAFGANWGDVFFSASLAGADRIRPEADGSLSMGFGLGDSRRVVGVELAYNLLSVRRFGENGGFDAKVHRQVYSSDETQVAAAVGLNNFASYGPEAGGSESSLYGVVTAAHLLQPDHPDNRLPITASVGLGGGSFSGEGSDVGVIAGVGLQVHPQFSVNTAWSGVGVNVGASIVPVPTLPLTLNLLYGDIGNNTQAGSVAVLSIGYGFNFGPRF